MQLSTAAIAVIESLQHGPHTRGYLIESLYNFGIRPSDARRGIERALVVRMIAEVKGVQVRPYTEYELTSLGRDYLKKRRN